MKKYQEYKDSGIEWIGEIPKHWERSRLKHIVSIKITDGPHETPTFYEQGIPFLSAEAININKLDFDKIRGYISAEQCEIYNKKCKVKKNDILFCKSGSTTGKSALVETDTEFAIWSPLAIIRARKEQFHYNYVFYAIQSLSFRTQVEIFWSFGTQPNIGMNVLENLWIPVPPFEIQIDIANFLRKKISLIDSAIQKKQQMIELLKEERAAIINQAVTKGINPDAEMKDSGIEWLGEVPRHWYCGKLGHNISVKARLGWKGLTASEYVEKGYGFLATPNIKTDEIDFVNINYITKERYEESPEIMLQIGDVLLAKDGSTLGIVNIVKKLPFECTVNSSIAVLRPLNTNIYSPFLKYFMQSHFVQNIIQMIKGGMGVPHLFQADIVKFDILIPPYEEQVEVTEYIDSEIMKIKKLIHLAEKEIALIEEYRIALINEAVTGKIDVRNV
jgi:type I restriction enzyme S subunit